MIGRQLIEAMRREPPEPRGGQRAPLNAPAVPVSRATPLPPPASQPPEVIIRLEGGEITEETFARFRDRLRAMRDAEPRQAVLGYAVARYGADGPPVLTHTSLMPLDEAQREADAQRKADQHGYSWAVMEIRSTG